MARRLKDPWLSISDMMTGLMMVFLFITVSYATVIKKESEKAVEEAVASHDDIENIVADFIDRRAEIANALHEEFDKDLKKWDASIDDDTLTFRFESPEVLFAAGDSKVSPLFEKILSDFWPRYLDILSNNQGVISEIKIEGHTSSEWSESVGRDESYFNNMELSQNRSRNVLEYCFTQTPQQLIDWSILTITANGFSFSRLKYDSEGREDPYASRRVEFTIMINPEESLKKISETL